MRSNNNKFVALGLLAHAGTADGVAVSGTVTDNQGQAIAGAVIRLSQEPV